MAAHPAIRKYIVDYARSIGIDPAIALRVAGHEALNVFDPSQPDRGGDQGSSFGPFQLHYGGVAKGMSNPGLGDAFTKATGLDARDPSTWPQQVKFALDTAKQGGWGPWMGAKAEGITGMMGITGRGTGEPVEVDKTLTNSISQAPNQYALPKAQAVGGAGVYQPPKQEISNTAANATTSPSAVTPAYGQNQPAEVEAAQPAPQLVANPLKPGEVTNKDNLLSSLAGSIGDIKLGAGAPDARAASPQTGAAARTDAPAVAPIAPVDPNRRMMLAQLMAQLNSRKLFG